MSMLMTLISNSSFWNKEVACATMLKHQDYSIKSYPSSHMYHQYDWPYNSFWGFRIVSEASTDLRIRIYNQINPIFHLTCK